MTLKELLLRVHKNLQILEAKEARQAGTVEVRLLNEIEDHQKAIALIEKALSTQLTETGLAQLQESLRPLLVAANIEAVELDTLKIEKPRFDFEPETVLIPAGPFLMGGPPGEDIPAAETPQHQVTLPAYRIGKYAVTNRQYAEFIKREPEQELPKKAGWYLREPPPEQLDHPVVGLSWHDALAYCRWLSKMTERSYRLPTEAEWEKAARGSDGRLYPWGNGWDAARCNGAEAGLGGSAPVGQYSPEGDSPFGVADMAGNVQEWTSTLWGSRLGQPDYAYPYRPDDGREDLEAGPWQHRTFRVHRGGAFREDRLRVTTFSRGVSDPDSKLRWRGFRVVLEI